MEQAPDSILASEKLRYSTYVSYGHSEVTSDTRNKENSAKQKQERKVFTFEKYSSGQVVVQPPAAQNDHPVVPSSPVTPPPSSVDFNEPSPPESPPPDETAAVIWKVRGIAGAAA